MVNMVSMNDVSIYNDILYITNELIDRDNFESERQCYYTCGDDDLVRVDTSISYPCQDFIREER